MLNKQFVNACLGLVALVYLCGITACSTTRIVKPLKAKEVLVGLDFGGPLIEFGGGTVPLPYSSLSGAYGIDSNLTAFAGLHLTALGFENVQLDLGVVHRIYQTKKRWLPSISTGLSTQLLLHSSTGAFRAYPVVDLNFYWQYLKSGNNYVYANWSTWFDFWDRANGAPNSKMARPSFGLGHTFENAKMRYTIEGKYMLPGEESGGTPVTYRGIGGRGAVGVYFSISRKF